MFSRLFLVWALNSHGFFCFNMVHTIFFVLIQFFLLGLKMSEEEIFSEQSKKKIRNLCLLEYMNGLSLREIAVKHSVPYETLRTWHYKEIWKEKKKENQREIYKKVVEDNEDAIVKIAKNFLTTILEIQNFCMEKIRQNRDFADIERSLKILESCAKIYNSANVDLPEKIVKTIAKRLNGESSENCE